MNDLEWLSAFVRYLREQAVYNHECPICGGSFDWLPVDNRYQCDRCLTIFDSENFLPVRKL